MPSAQSAKVNAVLRARALILSALENADSATLQHLIYLQHDEKKPGDVLKVPGDPLDDVADDARYGIDTFITTTEKPRELVIADHCRQLAEQGDLTSASIRYQQMIAETQVAARPIRLGRYRRC